MSKASFAFKDFAMYTNEYEKPLSREALAALIASKDRY